MKRTPLARRTGLRRKGWIRRISAKRLAIMPARRDLVRQVIERDGRCRFADFPELGPCFGPLTAHEPLSRNRSGRRDENILDPDRAIAACSHHNSTAEGSRLAHDLGLVTHSWDAPPSPKTASHLPERGDASAARVIGGQPDRGSGPPPRSLGSASSPTGTAQCAASPSGAPLGSAAACSSTGPSGGGFAW